MKRSTKLINPYPDSSRKKERGLKSMKLEMKKEDLQSGHHRNTKDHKRPLHATMCQQKDNLEEMNKFLER